MSPSSHHVPTASTPTGREPPPNDELPTVAPSHDPRPCRMTWRRASRSAWEKLAISAYWLAPGASPSSPRQGPPGGPAHEPPGGASPLCRPLSKRRYVPRRFANPRPPGSSHRIAEARDAAPDARKRSYYTFETPASTLAVTCAPTEWSAAPHAKPMSASVRTKRAD